MTSPASPDLAGRTAVVVEKSDGSRRVFAAYTTAQEAAQVAAMLRSVGARVELAPADIRA